MTNSKDTIYTEAELAQEFPNLSVIGGKKGALVLTNCTLRKAIKRAEERAYDTGMEARVLGENGRVLAQV